MARRWDSRARPGSIRSTARSTTSVTGKFTPHDVRYGVTSLEDQQLPPAKLLQAVRNYWGIEHRQHHRRDATQGEDLCSMRGTTLARNFSLLRSTAISLIEHRSKTRRGQGPRAMPGWQQNNYRHPNALIRQLRP